MEKAKLAEILKKLKYLPSLAKKALTGKTKIRIGSVDGKTEYDRWKDLYITKRGLIQEEGPMGLCDHYSPPEVVSFGADCKKKVKPTIKLIREYRLNLKRIENIKKRLEK